MTAVSYGTCEECGTRTSKGAMLAHLRKCGPSLDAHSGDAVPLLLLRAASPGLRMFWLDIAIRADASLAQLDRILRDTWLECCGHLSAFRYGGLVYMTATDDPFDRHRGERGMNAPVAEVFRTKGHKVAYEYDFGSTTALQIWLTDARLGAASTRARVIARNEPPTWTCIECDQPASLICSFCFHEEDAMYCAGHAPTHGCGEEGFLPVVNSPRIGTCGYTGVAY